MLIKTVNGGVGAILEVYDDKVLIKRGGIFSAGRGDKMIPIKSITGITFKKPGLLYPGYIQFCVPGNIVNFSNAMDAAKDDNSIIFRKDAAEFEEVKNIVENKILEGGK